MQKQNNKTFDMSNSVGAPIPTQPANAVYAGSLQDSEQAAKKVKADKNEWMKYSYPNRKLRRMYEVKGKSVYARTKEEIESGITPMMKYSQVLRDRIQNGEMRHKAFKNDVATDHMHFERNKEQAMLVSLTEALGAELGRKTYNFNRKLNGIIEDKKMSR